MGPPTNTSASLTGGTISLYLVPPERGASFLNKTNNSTTNNNIMAVTSISTIIYEFRIRMFMLPALSLPARQGTCSCRFFRTRDHWGQGRGIGCAHTAQLHLLLVLIVRKSGVLVGVEKVPNTRILKVIEFSPGLPPVGYL